MDRCLTSSSAGAVSTNVQSGLLGAWGGRNPTRLLNIQISNNRWYGMSYKHRYLFL